MKITKILTTAAALVIVLLVVGWFLRNTLIQRFSGPILANFDIELVDVSLDALATDDAQIGYLELAHAKGTTVRIEGLTLPLGKSADGLQNYTAEKVSIITATRTEGEPFELARLIDQFLSLPENLAGSEIRVAEFDMAPYPTMHNLQWSMTQTGQMLRATVASIEIETGATRISDREYEISFSIPGAAANANEHTIAGHLRRNNSGIAIAGAAEVDLAAWERLVKLAGIVPDPATIESGSARIEFDGSIPYDTRNSPSIQVTLTPSNELQLAYANDGTSATTIAVTSAGPLHISATFPVVEWSLRQNKASLLVSYEDWQRIPLLLTDLACDSGNTCRMNSRIRMDDAALPFGSVEQIDAASSLAVAFSAAGPLLELRSGGKLTASGIKTNDTHIRSWESTLVSTAILTIVDAGWQLDAGSVDANLESLSVGDNLLISAPLYFENVTVADQENLATAKFDVLAPSARAALDSQDILLPGVRGSVTRRDDDVEFNLVTVDLFEDGSIRGRYELSSGRGEISVSGTAISLSEKNLSAWAARWSKDWDLIAGTVAVAGQIAWHQDAGPNLSGHLSVESADLAGYYGDIAFTGLSTALEATVGGEDRVTVAPSSISVALIDIGLPVQNVTADYVLNPDFRGADVTDLRMTAFDGVIHADPFSFHTDKESNTVTMRAESMNISEILTLKEFDAIEVSGRIGAELPITITSEGVTVIAGTLTGEDPGGVIRYSAGDAADEAVASSIGLVKEALSHFEYDTLTSELSYNQQGDLELAMQLKGRNPDMDGNRPVILNLNVENNVPQMLRSLQAARAVEELLERQLAE